MRSSRALDTPACVMLMDGTLSDDKASMLIALRQEQFRQRGEPYLVADFGEFFFDYLKTRCSCKMSRNH